MLQLLSHPLYILEGLHQSPADDEKVHPVVSYHELH